MNPKGGKFGRFVFPLLPARDGKSRLSHQLWSLAVCATMATANELRQILKEDSTGKNLYEHLTETLMRIVLERPANAYDSFELISADVKANPMNPDPEKGKPVPPSAEEVSARASYRSPTPRPARLARANLPPLPQQPHPPPTHPPHLLD